MDNPDPSPAGAQRFLFRADFSLNKSGRSMLPPHPATVSFSRKSPHAATVLQAKVPHRATVVPTKLPHRATVVPTKLPHRATVPVATIQRMDLLGGRFGGSFDDDDAEPALDRKLDVAQRFAKIVEEATDEKIFLAGGAAVALLGGPRPINDLDFRIICDFTFTDADGVAFIERLNNVLTLNEQLAEEEPFNERFACMDATGHTIMGEWDNCEISISRTETVRYLGITRHKTEKLNLRIIRMPDLVYDKALSLCFRDKDEKATNDLVDLLHLLKGRKLENGNFIYVESVKNFARLRGAAFARKIRELYDDDEEVPAPTDYLRKKIGALIIKANVKRLLRQWDLEEVCRQLLLALT